MTLFICSFGTKQFFIFSICTNRAFYIFNLGVTYKLKNLDVVTCSANKNEKIIYQKAVYDKFIKKVYAKYIVLKGLCQKIKKTKK